MSGHRARKRFGQNFLEDDAIIQLIVRSIRPMPGEHLVEIGPGKGALTSQLYSPDICLDLIELDRDLVPLLEAHFGQSGSVHIHQADALAFDFRQLQKNDEALRIVGNLPYNISTPLIFHLLEHQHLITDMHFMLQLEVVQRLAASPREKNYGRLSVMAQYFCKVEMLFEVPPEAFNPQPKVQSAIVRLTPYDKPPFPADDVKHLQWILKQAFSQRRKTLKNTLKNIITAETLETLGIDATARAETLTLEQFVLLSNFLNNEQNTKS